MNHKWMKVGSSEYRSSTQEEGEAPSSGTRDTIVEAAKKMEIAKAASMILSNLSLLAEIRSSVSSTEEIVGVLVSRSDRALFAAKCRADLRAYSQAEVESEEAERLRSLAAAVWAIASRTTSS